MAIKLRQATFTDAGKIAYLILVWDNELPDWLKMVRGDAAGAHRTAELMCSPKFVTWVAEEDGEVVAAMAINQCISLFGWSPYGNIAGLFVLPKYRGGRMIGLRLLYKAKELKQQYNWAWLEMNPWADDKNTKKVLERLAFDEAVHTHVLR